MDVASQSTNATSIPYALNAWTAIVTWSNVVNDGACSEYRNVVISKSTKACGMLRHVFLSKHRNLQWSAFMYYMHLILTHCYSTPAWKPFLKRDITAVECVQRSFTKSICGLDRMSYENRFRQLNALSLTNIRPYTNMVPVFKYLHGHVNFSPVDAGLEIVAVHTWAGG